MVSKRLSNLFRPRQLLVGSYRLADIRCPMGGPVLELVVNKPLLEEVRRKIASLFKKSKFCEIKAL